MKTVFFDMETGGVTFDKPIIQLAAIAVDDEWKELETFERKIKFDESKADPGALAINHYNREVWEKEGIPEALAQSQFNEFLNRHKSISIVSKRTGRPYQVARLAGHNSSFDKEFLKRMYGDQFLPAHPLVLDTLQLALWHFHGKTPQPDKFTLTVLLNHLGIELPDAHDALADVRGSIALAKALTPVQI
ncbi:MAG TPA: 3'-5' exonuclease [Terriglobia bacterium]|nr:3'-5' exonuclease [Terriglobia bacterium]